MSSLLRYCGRRSTVSFSDHIYQIIGALQQGHPPLSHFLGCPDSWHLISGSEILEELSRLRTQLHKHPTCQLLQRHMQHLCLPTNTAYRITEDHKFFRSDLRVSGSAIEDHECKRFRLTPTAMITQFPTPFPLGGLEATQAIQSSHNRSSRYCQQRSSSPQSRFGRQST